MRAYKVAVNGKFVFQYQMMTKAIRSERFKLRCHGKVSISSFPEEDLN